MAALYDTIGADYRRFRQPDPRIGVPIIRALGSAASVVNIGAACACLAYLYRRARQRFGPQAALYGTAFLAFAGIALLVGAFTIFNSLSITVAQRSREFGLVLNADNVRRGTSFMCHCCPCCCNVLLGVSRHGYPNTVVTSSFIAASDRERCLGCGTCSRRCPVSAVPREPDPDPRFRKHGRPRVDEGRCLGCGVCATTCRSGAMRLHPRARRVLHPEDTFERVLLQCLERGTLQNQLLDDPASKTQAFLRPVVGAFLRLPPVKQALMSDALRSRFLGALRRAAGKKAPPGVIEA